MSGKLLDTYPAGSTIYALFDTFGSSGQSITLTGLATSDVEIYKDGSTTQRASDAGIALLDTDGIDFDAITGIHGISIDLSDNTDASFYAVGSQYTVVISSVTIDSQTVSFILGSFRIVAAEGTAGYPAVDMARISNDATAADNLETMLDGTGGQTLTASITGNITGNLSGSVGSVTGAVGSVTAGVNLADGAITAAKIAADAITAAKVASDVSAEIADAVWDEDATGHQTQGTFGQAIGDPGSNSSTLWATMHQTVSSLLTEMYNVIRANTAQAGAAGTITLDSGASASDDFYNNTLILITGGTGSGQSRFITDYVGSTKVATVNANWVTNPSSDSTFTIFAFGSIPGASAPTASEVADAVWDEALSGHTTAGTAGKALSDAGSAGDPWSTALPGSYTAGQAGYIIGTNLDGTVSSRASQTSVDTVDSNVDAILVDTAEIGAAGAGLTAVPWNASWDAEVQSEVADALTAYDPPTKAELDSGLAALNDLDAAGVRTAVGLASANLDTQLAALPTAAENADAVWDESTTGHVTAGTFGEQVKTDIDAILTDTAEIGAAGAGLTALATQASVNTIDANVDSILADTGTDGVVVASASKTGYALTSDYDFAKGTVAATEAYATDGAAATPIQLLYMIWGMLAEKSVAATTLTVKKLDGSTSAMTFTLDDGTTPTSITRAS